MRALCFIMGAALALAALKVAVQVSIIILLIMLVAALIIDPIGTLIRLGGATVFAVFLISPVAALLLLNALLLAGMIATYAADSSR